MAVVRLSFVLGLLAAQAPALGCQPEEELTRISVVVEVAERRLAREAVEGGQVHVNVDISLSTGEERVAGLGAFCIDEAGGLRRGSADGESVVDDRIVLRLENIPIRGTCADSVLLGAWFGHTEVNTCDGSDFGGPWMDGVPRDYFDEVQGDGEQVSCDVLDLPQPLRLSDAES